MKKFLFILFGVFVFAGAFAAGENIPTSKSHVDSKLVEKQDIIPANDGVTQVLTNTGTAGEYGTKEIYDANGEYATQQNNLVDAQTMNAGMQNAIDSEFQCIEWLDPNDHTSDCLLFNIFGETGKSVLPTGFTALEYIESTGTQYIDLGQSIGSGENIIIKFEYITNRGGIWFGARDGDYHSAGFSFDYSNGANTLLILSHNAYISTQRGFWFRLSSMTPYVLNWHGEPFQNPGMSPNIIPTQQGTIDETNYLVTPPYNAYLFACNRAGSAVGFKPMRIYHFEVKSKINFIPARRDSDGEIGMYDTVTNSFFTNAGTGEFIAGPVVNLYLPSGN